MKYYFYSFAVFLFISIQPCLSQDKSKDRQKKDSTSNSEFNVRTQKVSDNLFMLTGKGGNIGVFTGEDGVFMIDDKFEESTPSILSAVKNISDKPVKFLVNTHFHGDHLGGNDNMHEKGAIIFAHENVRKTLLNDLMIKASELMEKKFEEKVVKLTSNGMEETLAQEKAKRDLPSMESLELEKRITPMITFSDDLTFNFNDEKIMVFHVHNAHTDGDAMIFFTKSNVLHTGDAFVNGQYPFIDADHGGTFSGYQSALSKIQMIANEDTKIIPGHGEIASLADVKYMASMLEFITKNVDYHRIAKKTVEQVLAMKDITKEYDNKGFGNGFISTEKLIRAAYQESAQKYSWNTSSKKN